MRIKRGVVSHRKHKKLLESVKGYRMTKRRLVRVAHEAALHAGQYAFSGRRRKKSDMRRIWIVRISEAIRDQGLNYSRFIEGMKKAKITLDRKILANFVVEDTEAFKAIVDKVKKS
jgi:large subunit ribosomal protein L20